MESITDISNLFQNIQGADLAGSRWYTSAVPSLNSPRILLSRSVQLENCIFIQGSLDSFGSLPALGNIEHRLEAVDAATGEVFPALRISAPSDPNGNLAITHIAYELTSEITSDPKVDNSSLINRVAWILEVLGRQGAPMSRESQRGLLGECFLLSQLLTRALSGGIGPESVIEKWVRGRRDFAGGGIAIEVKSTAAATRRHRIGSIEQLDPEDDSESVFLFSLGLTHDASSQTYLPDYLQRIFDQLVSPTGEPLLVARQELEEKLKSAGYDPAHEGIYRSGEGISQRHSLPPRLFAVDELDRLTYDNFVGGELPGAVTNVSYEMNVSGEPLNFEDTDSVLDMLITG